MIFKKKDSDAIYECISQIKIHNYPASFNTFPYITRSYKTVVDGNVIEEEGEPIYFHELDAKTLNLVLIGAMAMNQLSEILPHSPEFTKLD